MYCFSIKISYILKYFGKFYFKRYHVTGYTNYFVFWETEIKIPINYVCEILKSAAINDY